MGTLAARTIESRSNCIAQRRHLKCQPLAIVCLVSGGGSKGT